MTAREDAESLVNEFKVILMNEDTDCGNEVLCTLIAKKCAKVAVKRLIESCYDVHEVKYYVDILIEIDNA